MLAFIYCSLILDCGCNENHHLLILLNLPPLRWTVFPKTKGQNKPFLQTAFLRCFITTIREVTNVHKKRLPFPAPVHTNIIPSPESHPLFTVALEPGGRSSFPPQWQDVRKSTSSSPLDEGHVMQDTAMQRQL